VDGARRSPGTLGRLMAARIPGWSLALWALAPLALAPTTAAEAQLQAAATVAPASGYPGERLVATYSFTPKSSCAAYHMNVSWSFGATVNWVSSTVPTKAGTTCASSTPATAPPGRYGPCSYMVCGTDTSLSSSPACATYTIKARSVIPTPTASPRPTPRASPSSSPSVSQPPSPSAAPGAVRGTASPSSAPPGSSVGGGPSDVEPAAGNTGGLPGWPWVAVLLLVLPLVADWRFRSWLVGVFENVEVLGKSGADLETELLHHDEASPAEVGADVKPPIEEY